jgi:hypothetical protein
MPTALEVGTSFIETLWYSYACRIIDKAIELYNLDEEKANEIKLMFLKRGDYCVTLT